MFSSASRYGVAVGLKNADRQGFKGGDFPQGNTTRPLTVGKEQNGRSDKGVWGRSPIY